MLLTRSGLFSSLFSLGFGSSFSAAFRAPAAESGSGASTSSGASVRPLSVVSASAASTHFPPGVIVKGDLSADEDMVIEGFVSGGSIDMPSYALTIGPDAQVDARVLARDVTIYGTLRGKVTALEILDIRPSAKIAGDFAAPAVALADGAQVQGRIETKRVDAAMHVARYRLKTAQR
jgi:cytoskeletal protein CcmA (bactofilin family)